VTVTWNEYGVELNASLTFTVIWCVLASAIVFGKIVRLALA
jgi:hypothetical protein